MKRERYSIIYSSKTGNTKKLAEAIYNTLSQNKCDYYGTVDKIDDVLSNVIYIGFWTEKGNAGRGGTLTSARCFFAVGFSVMMVLDVALG